MPKVHFVKCARKDNPAVKKGEPYYHWSFYRGPTVYSATRPRPSQLTQSEKLSTAYSINEAIEDYRVDVADKDGFEGALNEAKSFLEEKAQEIRDLADEYRQSADNIRESFSESPTADDCEEKADNLESWADELDSAVSEIESIDLDFEDGQLELQVEELSNAICATSTCPL